MGWRRDVTDPLLPVLLRSRVGIRLLAWACRHFPETRGAARLGEAVFPKISREGTARATFGRGRTVVCDLSVQYDRSVFAGREETSERQLVDRLLDRGDVFVDVGANLGLFTVFAAANVGDRGRVYSFEAVPSTATRLRASVEASGHASRVQVCEVALSDSSGAQVQLAGHRHNTMRIVDDPGSGAQSATTATLDEVLGPTDVVAGIKIDVDGHEPAVLRGAEETIRHWSPWILVEFNSEIVGVRTLADWDVHRSLTELGYRAHRPWDVMRDDLAPLPDDWVNVHQHTNLIYWRGPTPPPLDPSVERSGRHGRVAKHGPADWPPPLDAARLALAEQLGRADRARRALWRRLPHGTNDDGDLSAPPTGVMAAIAHWRKPDVPATDRFRDLARVVDSILAMDVDHVTVAVLSNAADATARDLTHHFADSGRDLPVRTTTSPRGAVHGSGPAREVVVLQWRPGLTRRHGFYLTWAHVPVLRRAMRSKRFSHCIYLEDDILFTDAHLRYWCTYRPALADIGLLPGFVRFESRDASTFVVDQVHTVDPSQRRKSVAPATEVPCHDFVNLPNPHQAMYVLDRPLAATHYRFSTARSPLRSAVIAAKSGWGLCERNSAGPIFDEVPSGMFTRNVVPVSDADGRVQLDPACLIEHISATYVWRDRSLFAKIPVDELFSGPASPT